MAEFRIKKGLDIRLEGKPSETIGEVPTPSKYAVYPGEFAGIKPRILIKEGDQISRGDVLFENKKNTKMVFRAPCGGTIKRIMLGARRAPQEILIEKADTGSETQFNTFTAETIQQTKREELVDHLLHSGLWPLIRQRPFSRIANPEDMPKAVFVNAMSNGPFQGNFSVALKGAETSFQAGLHALAQLTDGKVHLCHDGALARQPFSACELHTFTGPYPSGNTSVHINRITPILPGDAVYTVRAQDVLLIGELLLTGRLPRSKVIALGGPGVKPEYQKHYRIELGADLKPFLDKALSSDEVRIINGHALYGEPIVNNQGLPYYGAELTVLEEDTSRDLLGWTMPGLKQYSAHRVTLGALLRNARNWKLGTNLHGGHRAMVVTGWFDRYQPLNIMSDHLIRAVLAHDTTEAVQLGILETDPEDFALSAFIDPSKTDLCKIIRDGLDEIEREGL